MKLLPFGCFRIQSGIAPVAVAADGGARDAAATFLVWDGLELDPKILRHFRRFELALGLGFVGCGAGAAGVGGGGDGRDSRDSKI